MRRLTLFLLFFALLAYTALADPPPPYAGYPGGWGMNPNNWFTHTGYWSEPFSLYNPGYPGIMGSGWIVDWSDPLNPIYIMYAPITLNLWIEMYAAITYQYTSYKWHRLGNNAETVNFIIEGTVQSNSEQFVSLAKTVQDLTHLWFQENIFGGDTPSPAPDIPVSWQGRWGTGLSIGQGTIKQDWTPLTPNPDVTLFINEVCDHWFQFKGEFLVQYHQPDGYYNLNMSGRVAPGL